jgi:predicted nucleic acid-binding protein
MPDRAFFDTNILVYAFDRRDATRQAISSKLLEQGLRDRTAVLSLQVLQEFYVVSTRKISVPLEPARARNLVAEFLRHDEVETTAAHLLQAMDLSTGAKLSFWDSLIAVTAVEARCKIIYTEDFKHDSTILGVRVVNPFKR